METKQPKWEFIANLGDAHPIDYGGLFVYRDTTGVYPCECEKLFPNEDGTAWEVQRFILERCKLVNGLLIPFRYDESWPHPAEQYSEWFNADLAGIASYIGVTTEELQSMFCSDNPLELARAYESLGEYHGFDNLDAYPLFFKNRAEVEARYKVKNA